MKKLTYTLFSALFLLLGSCNKDESLVTPSDKVVTTDITSPSSTEIITPETPLPFMTRQDLKIKNAAAPGSNLRVATWTEFGPYTVTTATTKIATNTKIQIMNSPNYANTIYICDVYSSTATFTTPSGTLMNFKGATKLGYSNYTNQTPGVVINQTGNTYSITSYSIVPRYNMIGQSTTQRPIPEDLTGTTFSYTYLQDI